MERILRIFYNNGSFFTFVGLQLLCLYLIANYNSNQAAIAAETWSIHSGKFKSALTKVNGYLDLREQNEIQRREIARLRSLLPESGYNITTEIDSVQDDSMLQRFNFLTTRIVNRSPYNPNNTLVIDRGARFNVRPGQGIMNENGLIGIVDRTTDRHARVLSILHQSTRISAGLANRGYGTLRWNGLDPRRMTLIDLPDYVDVEPNDTVYTTGFSNIFPTGQIIGTVESFERQPGAGSLNLTVLLSNDPLRATHGYVVQDLFKEELGSLNEQ